jgi:predicted nucleic acid-binding protein
VVQAQRRGRIGAEQAWEILSSFEGLGIELLPVAWQPILPLAQRFGRSAYDAVYLALAESTRRPLVTADLRLYRAVQGHLSSVQWLGEYPL